MLSDTVFKFEIPLFSSKRVFDFKIFLMTLEAAQALLMVSFQSCLGQGSSSFALRGETVSFHVFLCYREPPLIHNNRISSSALPPPSKFPFLGVVGVALMLGATPDHAIASSLDAGEPRCDSFLGLPGERRLSLPRLIGLVYVWAGYPLTPAPCWYLPRAPPRAEPGALGAPGSSVFAGTRVHLN